jgi:hypothetical protein
MLKSKHEILVVDPRFSVLDDKHVLGRRLSIVEEHYEQVEAISLTGSAPLDVRVAFDRARNAFVYAWYCYELLVVCEMQAFAALELALRLRLHVLESSKNGGLDHLFRRATQENVLPALENRRVAKLIALRNKLAHGHLEIHTPKMALQLLSQCAAIIDQLFATSSTELR